jgi:hemoglobin
VSIYDELQQEHGISLAVNEFYERVTNDPALAHYFDGVDLPHLRAHQVKLLAQVTGGPQAYAGRSVAEAHQGLGITSPDFDRVVGHLGDALSSLGVHPETIAQIAGVLAEHRSDVVADPVESFR